MSRYLVMIMAVALAGAAVLMGPAAGAGTLAGATGAGGAWGRAEEVPGTGVLSSDGGAAVNSVSCPSAGNCSAGGHYMGLQPFVVSQVHGVWEKAANVPGMARLNKFGAEITSVSCASAGNCSAGGYYGTGNTGGETEAFVVSQVHGTWGKAEEVPGTARLNTFGGAAAVSSVSCASAGNCSAGGDYTSSSSGGEAFVVSQVHGVWGKAKEVPGTAALNTGGNAFVSSVSCGAAGNCSAIGPYTSSSGNQVFVVSQVNGTWGTAEEVPGTAALNKGSAGPLPSVSCGSAGNCSAGGSYTDSAGHQQAFVVSQVNGTWGKAEEVPGTAALNTGGFAEITSVSCGAAGNCSAGGSYATSSGGQAFVVSQVNGTWGTAEKVPGIAALNTGGNAFVSAVSCGAVGNCSAGGDYADSSGDYQVFVVSQAHGVWGKAEEVPGSARLNKDHEAGAVVTNVAAVSCASAGHCSAGGYYTNSAGNQEAFVVSRT